MWHAVGKLNLSTVQSKTPPSANCIIIFYFVKFKENIISKILFN